jgi:ABC-type Zn uptake system ZnuABC Zn-binding protein ZnuA
VAPSSSALHRGLRGLTVLLALTAVVCGGRDDSPGRVAASIFPLYDITRRVAGDRVGVDLVLPPGQTEHSFDPKPGDVARLAHARMVFAVGLGLDEWLGEMAKNAGTGRARLFELGPLMDPILVPENVVDPHFWLDPVRMQGAVDVVADALAKLDPEDEPRYRLRAAEVKRSLADLHRETARRAAAWPHRKLVTFHGSMYYFAARYGLEVVAVVEPLPGREPTGPDMTRVLEAIRKAGVVPLLFEPQLDPRAARTLAAEAGVPLYEIDPIGGTPATDSYEKLLRQITEVLDRALQ